MKNCPSSKLVGREECGRVHLLLGGHRRENSDMPPWLPPPPVRRPGYSPTLCVHENFWWSDRSHTIIPTFTSVVI